MINPLKNLKQKLDAKAKKLAKESFKRAEEKTKVAGKKIKKNKNEKKSK